jgi:hypothetical protein
LVIGLVDVNRVVVQRRHSILLPVKPRLGTNQAQGSEREAVVVIHPLVGYREAPTFAVDTGRLCVALSRHRGHASVVLDTSTDDVLRRAQAATPGNTTLAVQRHVLDALLSLA